MVETSARKWGNRKKRVIATTNKLYKQKFGIDALVCGQYDLFFALFEEPQKKVGTL